MNSVDQLELDITTRTQYLSGVANYGRRQLSAPVVELKVRIPTTLGADDRITNDRIGTVVLFVSPQHENYIIGFRGKEKCPFALPDAANVDQFSPLLAKALGIRDPSSLVSNIRADHRALGSFEEPFRPYHLTCSDQLNHFTAGREDLRMYLALLIAMIAEGSRFASVRQDFASLFDGQEVLLRRARVQNYGKAKLIVAHGAQHRIALNILLDRLQHVKGLADQAVRDIERATGAAPPKHDLLQWVYSGSRNPAFDAAQGAQAEIRARLLELHLKPHQARDFLTKISDDDVVQTARDLSTQAATASKQP